MDMDKQEKVGDQDATLMEVAISLLEPQQSKVDVVEVSFRNPITTY